MNDEEFLKDFEQMLKNIEALEKTKPVEYRLYLVDDKPSFFSMEQLDMPFVMATKEDYDLARIDRIEIVDNKITYRKLEFFTNNKLTRGAGGFSTLKNDMQFVVHKDYVGEVTQWKIDERTNRYQ